MRADAGLLAVRPHGGVSTRPHHVLDALGHDGDCVFALARHRVHLQTLFDIRARQEAGVLGVLQQVVFRPEVKQRAEIIAADGQGRRVSRPGQPVEGGRIPVDGQRPKEVLPTSLPVQDRTDILVKRVSFRRDGDPALAGRVQEHLPLIPAVLAVVLERKRAPVHAPVDAVLRVGEALDLQMVAPACGALYRGVGPRTQDDPRLDHLGQGQGGGRRGVGIHDGGDAVGEQGGKLRLVRWDDAAAAPGMMAVGVHQPRDDHLGRRIDDFIHAREIAVSHARDPPVADQDVPALDHCVTCGGDDLGALEGDGALGARDPRNLELDLLLGELAVIDVIGEIEPPAHEFDRVWVAPAMIHSAPGAQARPLRRRCIGIVVDEPRAGCACGTDIDAVRRLERHQPTIRREQRQVEYASADPDPVPGQSRQDDLLSRRRPIERHRADHHGILGPLVVVEPVVSAEMGLGLVRHRGDRPGLAARDLHDGPLPLDVPAAPGLGRAGARSLRHHQVFAVRRPGGVGVHPGSIRHPRQVLAVGAHRPDASLSHVVPAGERDAPPIRRPGRRQLDDAPGGVGQGVRLALR